MVNKTDPKMKEMVKLIDQDEKQYVPHAQKYRG